MFDLVAVIRPEIIEGAGGLHEVVVADFFRKGVEPRQHWIAHISGVEIWVSPRPTDTQILGAVAAELALFEQGPAPDAVDTRKRRVLDSALVGKDIEPSRR